MPSRAPVPAPHGTAITGRESAQGNVVLDRVAARVRQRQAAEQAATNRVGDGSHAASLIWPWPF
ncbi:HaaA family cyclophane-containing RiPP peptide [Streptomyces sp. NBC_00343]|uniref:HaaA family cyclophane-containing RiPP peptide n=1 Tax=Streptomyces sp. NBC_00343 TaxID=2975719 RepID=UPI002E2E286E|nr:HaaA family cyclophane-containing RiPP peptide [Streptomyces sp. NBC_00343]